MGQFRVRLCSEFVSLAAIFTGRFGPAAFGAYLLP